MNAPPVTPSPLQVVTMQVVLPPEDALEQMFAGMLDAIGDQDSQDGLARQLAQLLPTGLSRLKDLRFDSGVIPAPFEASTAADATPATADPVHPR